MSQGSNSTPTPDQKSELAAIAAARAQRAKSGAAYRANPKNAKLKKAYVFDTVKLGMHLMYSTALPPKDKYKPALELFKEALKLDPKNQDAKKAAAQIEEIYRMIAKKRSKG